jgi:V/A-type H+-transporting ATPase subunit E
MDSVEKEKAALIAGIETDVQAEAEKIIAEAEKKAAEKRVYAEKKIESVLNEARQKAAEQAETAKKKIVSGAELEAKRHSMHVRDAAMHDVLDLAEKKLYTMIDSADYRSVLASWITEAAIGLDAESVQVNASEKERPLINDQLLSEVADRIRAQTGRQVKLTLADGLPLKSQGVVVTAAGGRTAFNNQVKTRMLRKQRKIRAVIYDALFGDSGKERL